MVKTMKYKKKFNNKTKKNLLDKNMLSLCPIGLKPFEDKINNDKLQIKNKKHVKEFIKELLSKFAPNSIKPENDFYDYINYQWLKNVSIEKQQDYITQIDDFRLIQDKVYH